MVDEQPRPDAAAALDSGRALVDRRRFHVVEVAGADACGWLDDLLTTAVAELTVGSARRALVLSPTGRLRADIHVVAAPAAMLLVQDPAQPHRVDELLAPYVLSSDVELRVASIAVVCAPGGDAEHADLPDGVLVARPSMLGGGADVVADASRADAVVEALRGRRLEVDEGAVRAWEIRRGIPRYPLDVDDDSLPAEGGLDATAVDSTKGCFLGQESVARVRNLGHPPRVVLAGRVPDGAARGDRILAGGRVVGEITGAAAAPGGATDVLARVRWDARDAALTTETGSRFTPAPSADRRSALT
jgi:folate-binding protein YgfZ